MADLKTIAFFDFDGTISRGDSFLLFLRRFAPWRFAYACLRFSPQLLAYLLGRYPDHLLKETMIRAVMGGRKRNTVEVWAAKFCADTLPGIVRVTALEAIRHHRVRGDRLVLVTASPRIFLEPWCRAQGMDILGTELELDGLGRITGKLKGKNCKGEEKVRRIREKYTLASYQQIFAYGDSTADLPMLDLAPEEQRFYRPFR